MIGRNILVPAAFALAAAAAPAGAAVVSAGPDAESGVDLGPGQALSAFAVSFTLGQDLTGVEISAFVGCIDCAGSMILQEGTIGPGAGPGGLVDGFSFDSTVSAFGSLLDQTLLFELPTLAAGDYFLIMAVETGLGRWARDGSPDLFAATGNSIGFQYEAAGLAAYVPASSFSAEINLSPYAVFTVDGAPAEVPAPASALLLAAACSALGLRRARR